MIKSVSAFVIASLVWASCGWCQDNDSDNGNDTDAVVGASDATAVQSAGRWATTLDDAVSVASETNKPIFVIVGAEWCVFCKQLEQELTDPTLSRIGERWVLAKIDADDRVSDARELRANGLPSLRLLSRDGIIAYSHDGYLSVAELEAWLDENYQAVKSNVPGMLEIKPADYSDQQIAELIEFIATRDVTVRRIILERLEQIPQRCVAKAIELLESDRLAKQLSALELLRRWQAPVEDLDPWIPGSIDQAVITRLRRWSQENYPDAQLDA